MSLEMVSLLLFAGFAAGTVSAIAGGSGLITFPILLSIGLPPTAANATNFVAVLFGNISALPAYFRELRSQRARAVRMIVIGLSGGGIGSLLLVSSSNALFFELIPWLMVVATVLFAVGDKARAWIDQKDISNLPIGYSLVFVVSIYGGYFGAGLGVVLLATLSVIGISDFHHANALKNLTNAFIGLFGVIIYAFADLISWPHALIMVCGSTLGGFLGIKLSRWISQRWMTRAIVALGVFLSIYYFAQY
ncbi:MAG: sulfite exporter TauE/SafE family protein [Pseudomonadota bacterium]